MLNHAYTPSPIHAHLCLCPLHVHARSHMLIQAYDSFPFAFKHAHSCHGMPNEMRNLNCQLGAVGDHQGSAGPKL